MQKHGCVAELGWMAAICWWIRRAITYLERRVIAAAHLCWVAGLDEASLCRTAFLPHEDDSCTHLNWSPATRFVRRDLISGAGGGLTGTVSYLFPRNVNDLPGVRT